MKIEDVKSVVGRVPFMSAEQARRMTQLVSQCNAKQILELGFAHGVSTCYLAAAVDGVDGAMVTSIDLIESLNRDPRAEDLLERCGLQHLVQLIREPSSFTWRLMKWLEEGRRECFDLVYLDGGHTWDITGFAFFLVDRLLSPGGLLIFDDIDWTFEKSPTLKKPDQAPPTADEYRNTAQVRKVFELLVQPHLAYEHCVIEDGWGIARKRGSPPGNM